MTDVSQNSAGPHFWRRGIDVCLIAESILGYVWWSTVFSLPSTIWFYPLNAMGVTGYEALGLLWCDAIILVVRPLDALLSSVSGNLLLRLLTVSGLLALHAPTTLSRLFIVAAANGTAILWFCTSLWDKSEKNRSLYFWGLINGYVIMLVSRIYYVSLNPVVTYPVVNVTVFGIAVMAGLYRAKLMWLDSASKDPAKAPEDIALPISKWLPISLSVSGWLSLMQLLFPDVAVLSRWVVTGYPQPGPMPNPWGLLVLMSFCIGVFVSEKAVLTNSLLWWTFGSVAAAVFYRATGYTSYYGGLCLCTYLVSIFPCLLSKMYRCPKAVTFTFTMLGCLIMVLGSVWTVGYNFVPGGVYTRERQDMMIAIAMGMIALGVYADTSSASIHSPPAGKESKQSSKQVVMQLLNPDAFKYILRKKFKIVMVLALVLSGLATARRISSSVQQRRKHGPPDRTFTAAMWTVHMGFDNVGWASFERATDFLRRTEASVIGIVESDCSRLFLGSTDLVMYLEENLGMYSDYGPSTKNHTWGAALLSIYPIVSSTHHLLPSPEGELAPAIHATLNVTGYPVDVLVTHMGNHWDDLDRKLQAETLAQIMNNSTNPMIFLGYVTSPPHQRDYLMLTRNGRMKDIDETDPFRWCEYIFYRGLQRLAYGRVSHGRLSDTELQMARFHLPSDPKLLKDNEAVSIDRKKVHPGDLLPSTFGEYQEGEHRMGNDGHYYHMSTPKYFVSG